jgi:hypothetical protein
MTTNTRRVEIDGELYDIPVEVYSRALSEAELLVLRGVAEQLAADVVENGAAAGEESAEDVAVRLLAAWDEHEDRMRSRLRLPPRHLASE